MTNILKYASAAALAGVIAIAATSPGEARDGRRTAAAAGFAAGAIVGAAAASNSGYYYGPTYYEPGYTYQPGYVYDSYAYEPAPVYVAPAPRYRYSRTPDGCASEFDGGKSFC